MAEDFNYPASSGSAQSVPVTFRIPSELHRVLDELFYCRKWPYRTPSDMYRHALHRLADWLVDQAPVQHNMDYIRAMNMALNRESELTAFQEILDKLSAEIQLHKKHGDREDAVRIVKTIMGSIQGMPKGAMRTRYLERVKEEFGYLGEIVELVEVEVGRVEQVALVSYDPEDAVKVD